MFSPQQRGRTKINHDIGVELSAIVEAAKIRNGLIGIPGLSDGLLRLSQNRFQSTLADSIS